MPFGLQRGTRGLIAQPEESGGGGNIGKTMWRILVTGSASNIVGMRLVEFRTESGGSNVIPIDANEIGYRGFATSFFSASRPHLAFGNNGSSLWLGLKDDVAAIGWRFDDPTEINEVYWMTATTANASPSSVSVQSSVNGGKDWQDEWSEGGLSTAANAFVTSTRP